MRECEKCNLPTDYDSNDHLCKQCADTEKGKSGDMPSSQPRATPCVCGSEIVGAKSMMQCVKCVRWWHPACVGLEGLSKYGCNSIINWHCPICFKFDPEIKEKIGEGDGDSVNESSDSSVKKEVRMRINEAVPIIVNEVVEGIKTALGDTQVSEMMKTANERVTKTWADIASKEQKKVINEVVEKTSETALKKSISLIDANLSEQKKRVRNVVISNIAEDSGREEDTSLCDIVINILGEDLSTNEIVTCKRLGKKTPGQTRPRLVLLIFKREEDAMYFHNWGRGRKLNGGIWVNPDLTRTEREAMYQRRQERRSKRPSDRADNNPARGGGRQRETENRADSPDARDTPRGSNSR